MQLIVEKPYEIDFILYLKRFFKVRLAQVLDIGRLRKIESDFYLITKNNKVDILEAALKCEEVLRVREFEYRYVLDFDPTKTLGGTGYRLLDIYKFINYGGLNSRAYPIFTKTFDYIKKNIRSIYDMYILSEGGL